MDDEVYIWERNLSFKVYNKLCEYRTEEIPLEVKEKYVSAVTAVHNDGEFKFMNCAPR